MSQAGKANPPSPPSHHQCWALPSSISRHSPCLQCQWWQPTLSSSLFWCQGLRDCHKRARLFLRVFLMWARVPVGTIRYTWASLPPHDERTGTLTDFWGEDKSCFRHGSAPLWRIAVNRTNFKPAPCSDIIQVMFTGWASQLQSLVFKSP